MFNCNIILPHNHLSFLGSVLPDIKDMLKKVTIQMFCFKSMTTPVAYLTLHFWACW